MLKIDERDRAIVRAVELDGAATLETIRSRTSLRSATIRNRMSRLRRAGVLGYAVPIVNPSALGHKEFAVYLQEVPKKTGSRLHECLCASSAVPWVVELGGDYPLMVGIHANDIFEIEGIFEDIVAAGAAEIHAKRVVARTGMRYYGRRYLAAGSSEPEVLRRQHHEKPLSLDELDLKVLSLVASAMGRTCHQLARAGGIAVSTFTRRRRELEQRGVIAGYLTPVDTAALGFQRYRAFVSLNKPSGEIERFARMNKHVTYLVRCFGAWDFEVGIETESREQFHQVKAELHETLEGVGNNLSLVPHLSYKKFDPFPMRRSILGEAMAILPLPWELSTGDGSPRGSVQTTNFPIDAQLNVS